MSGVKGATYVYVCRTPDGIKIGASKNVPQRMKWVRGEALRVWHRPDDAHRVEYNALRLVGVKAKRGSEWFDIPAEQAIEAVEAAIERVEAGTALKTRRQRFDEMEARAEREMSAFCDKIAEIMAAGNAIVAEYERQGYVWDRSIMNFRKPD